MHGKNSFRPILNLCLEESLYKCFLSVVRKENQVLLYDFCLSAYAIKLLDSASLSRISSKFTLFIINFTILLCKFYHIHFT